MSQIIKDQYQRPLRDLRISVTDKCNFRCPYCMPEEIFGEKFQFLKRQQLLSFEEIERVTRIIVESGALKLRITGGEPLIRQELETLVSVLDGIDGVEDIAMTTNGVLLPSKVDTLKANGLKRLTISLDSLDDAVFRQMNGNKAGVDDVLIGIDSAVKAGFSPIKINAVVQKGVNDHTIVDLAKWAKDNGHILRFIEFMDVGTMNGWDMSQVVSAKEIAEMIDAELPLERTTRNYASETAVRYRYRDGGGEIGIIASVTLPFCGKCSRMRLSVEGKLYTCLFATEGTDIKTPLREGASDEELRALIHNTWKKRTDRYSEDRAKGGQRRDKVEMYYIGG